MAHSLGIFIKPLVLLVILVTGCRDEVAYKIYDTWRETTFTH